MRRKRLTPKHRLAYPPVLPLESVPRLRIAHQRLQTVPAHCASADRPPLKDPSPPRPRLHLVQVQRSPPARPSSQNPSPPHTSAAANSRTIPAAPPAAGYTAADKAPE